MKKIPIYLLMTAGLCAAPGLYAQEESTAEVDRILSEIDQAPEQTAAAPVETGMEAPVVPAISVDANTEVEGLEISSAGDLKTDLITISYEDVELANMVSFFAKSTGANIIIPDSMNELVSGNLNDVNWRQALEVILDEKGYSLIEQKSGIYTIKTRDQLQAEPLKSETVDLQYITAEAALPAVQSMVVSSNARVVPIPQTNVLIITETAERLQEIRELVKLVDRPRRQVFIEAKFVELNDSAIQDLGINWQVLQGYTVRATGLTTEYERIDTRSTQDAQAVVLSETNSRDRVTDAFDGTSNSDVTGFSTGTFDASVQGQNFDSFDAAEGTISTIPTMEQMVTKQAILSADDFALTLSALQQLDGTRIVSNPKMLVANGQTATIHVGRNEPNIRAVPQGENATTFAYVLDGFIEIGVKLEVTPVISTDKNITVNIIPELSRLIGEKAVGEAGTSFPITQIRKINTEFAVESGKTVAIGGLTQTEDQEDVSKIPLLGDLPIIGKYLFTHTSTRQVQDEIIIFVTVDAIDTDDLNDADGIPTHGSLIYTWLNHQEAKRTAEAEDKLVKAGIMEPKDVAMADPVEVQEVETVVEDEVMAEEVMEEDVMEAAPMTEEAPAAMEESAEAAPMTEEGTVTTDTADEAMTEEVE